MSLNLTLQFISYWHVGSGDGQGAKLDAAVVKDPYGLPYVPGRQLKGLLREAMTQLQAAGYFSQANLVELLFGSASGEQQRQQTKPGMLVISNALLPNAEQQALIQQPNLVSGLYQALYATAIDERSGSAQDKSLRGIECVIPLTLHSRLDWQVTAVDEAWAQAQQQLMATQDLATLLTPALALIDHLGAHRSRGLGEVQLSLNHSHQQEAA